MRVKMTGLARGHESISPADQISAASTLGLALRVGCRRNEDEAAVRDEYVKWLRPVLEQILAGRGPEMLRRTKNELPVKLVPSLRTRD